MLLRAWTRLDEFVSEHKSKLWVALYIAIIVLFLFIGITAPLTLGPSMEGEQWNAP